MNPNFPIAFPKTMKTSRENILTTALARIRESVIGQGLHWRSPWARPSRPGPRPPPEKTFATPEAAVSALEAPAADSSALRIIFGPAWRIWRILTASRPPMRSGRSRLRLQPNQPDWRESDRKCVLEVGADFWPFPVPP
jgi:hypothetical protein